MIVILAIVFDVNAVCSTMEKVNPQKPYMYSQQQLNSFNHCHSV